LKRRLTTFVRAAARGLSVDRGSPADPRASRDLRVARAFEEACCHPRDPHCMMRRMPTLSSIPGVLDALLVYGSENQRDAPPDLLIEIPHGATRTADFDAVAAQLTSPLPEGLSDFFHVNTDAGAPELGLAVAERFVALSPTRSAAVLRCRIPRTFIDCNRRQGASPEEFKAGKVTPGLMPWITTAEDRALLRGLYDGYVAAVRRASEESGPGGAMLLLHTYAPRTVDVEVDLHIVEKLRRAYEPEVERTWPLRPEIDVIGRAMDGTSLAPARVVARLRERALPLEVADSATYPMHPSTLAYEHVMARPGRVLCVEVRRDLLADPFDPFVQMNIGADKVARLAGPLAAAALCWW